MIDTLKYKDYNVKLKDRNVIVTHKLHGEIGTVKARHGEIDLAAEEVLDVIKLHLHKIKVEDNFKKEFFKEFKKLTKE